MGSEDFAAQVAGVATLADPVRRELYLYVAAQPGPVTRDQACAAVDVPRHRAKFHLDRLVSEGLLDIDFKRPSGRGGPGAGRPAKRYRRSDRQVAVAIPERRYDLAGRLMASAIAESAAEQTPVLDALHRAATDEGTIIGDKARQWAGPEPTHERRVLAACATLSDYGFEPRRTDHTVLLVNCPFHTLAQEHTELVCGMNLTLIDAALTRLGDDTLQAALDPADGRCCVAIATDKR